MAMEIVLGLQADGAACPATPSGAAAAAGSVVTGPGGLLYLLEASLGLALPTVPAVRRLAQWRARLAAADAPGRFWHASFAVDPFATARLLLVWRDALVDAGWQGQSLASPRLADLAVAEGVAPPFAAGPADRLRSVIACLRDDPPPATPIASLRLLEPLALLPPGLRTLVEALRSLGTEITEEPMSLNAALGDLGVAQGMLVGLGGAPVAADGSFTLLEAETESAAAELVADLMAAFPVPGDMVMLATRATGMLDAALRRRHLPRLGVGSASPLRGLVQLLPLLLAVRWRPFNARRMLEMLQMPSSPIPREVRHGLLRVLPEQPGRGSAAWQRAIADGLEAAAGRYREQNSETAARRSREAAETVALWLEAPLADPRQGLEAAELVNLCAALAGWAQRQASLGLPLAASLAGHALALAEAVRESGVTRLPRLDLERLLDIILADGETDPDLPAEAAPWATASAPGAVWATAPVVFWWGFEPPPLPTVSPWSRDEQAELLAAGCLPWPAETALDAAAWAWRRPLLAARRQVLLVAIRPAEAEQHPLAHELHALLTPNPALRPRAEALLMQREPRLAGIPLPREPAQPLALPIARSVWSTAASLPVTRDPDSATALEALLACPFNWALRYRAGLRPGRFAEIAADDRLIGLLAHALAAELLLSQGADTSPEGLSRRASERLETLVEEAAAPLLQPGAAGELARLQECLPRAMAEIGRLLAEGGYQVVEAEAGREAADMPEQGERFRGAIDLLLRDAQGLHALLDLKWSRRSRQYRERLQQGGAIQLAAYAQLVHAGERAAYLLLADAVAVGAGQAMPGVQSVEPAPTLRDTWAAARASRLSRAVSLGSGQLRALGIFDGTKPPPDPDGASLAPKPPCSYCDHARLCGQKVMA